MRERLCGSVLWAGCSPFGKAYTLLGGASVLRHLEPRRPTISRCGEGGGSDAEHGCGGGGSTRQSQAEGLRMQHMAPSRRLSKQMFIETQSTRTTRTTPINLRIHLKPTRQLYKTILSPL